MKYREGNIYSKIDPDFRKKLYAGRKLRHGPTIPKIARDEKILIIPKETVGFVIGKNGNFVNDVYARYRVKTFINPETRELNIYTNDYKLKQDIRNEFVKRIKKFNGPYEPIKYTTKHKIYDAVK